MRFIAIFILLILLTAAKAQHAELPSKDIPPAGIDSYSDFTRSIIWFSPQGGV